MMCMSISGMMIKKALWLLSNNEKEMVLDMSRYVEQTQKYSTGTDVITGKEYSVLPDKKLTLSGKTSLILELDK